MLHDFLGTNFNLYIYKVIQCSQFSIFNINTIKLLKKKHPKKIRTAILKVRFPLVSVIQYFKTTRRAAIAQGIILIIYSWD